MKKLTVFLLLFCFSFVFSQSIHVRIDSLFTVLKQPLKPNRQVYLWRRISDAYSQMGKSDSALFAARHAFKIAGDANVDSLLAESYTLLGSCFTFTNDFTQALEYEYKALALADKSENPAIIWAANKELGLTFKQLKNYDESLKYLIKARHFVVEAVGSFAPAYTRTYSHIAEVYLGLGQTDSALRYIQMANELTPTGDTYGYARMLYIFAQVYQKKGDSELAESYYKRCISFSDVEKISLPYVTASIEFATHLLNAKQIKLARQYSLAAFNRAVESKNKLGVIDASALLKQAYETLGQKDSSYYYADVKDVYRDSVFNEQQLNRIQDIATGQQIKEKEEEVRLLQEALERKQNIQFILIAFGIVAFGLIFLMLSRSFITNEKVIEFLGVIALLIIFEFLNLLLHPFLERITNHSPVLMLSALVCIAALLVPLHHRAEHWATKKLVEKNKKIRLALAKETIQQLGNDGIFNT